MNQVKKFIHNHEGIVLIAIFVVIIRIPNLYEPYWNSDEAIFSLQLALPLVWLKAALMGFSLLALGFFYGIVRLWFGRSRLGLYLTVGFGLLISIPLLGGNLASGEFLLMTLILGVIWLVLHLFSRRKYLRRPVLFALGWFGLAWLAAGLHHQAKTQYLLPIVPPTIILIGFLITERQQVKKVIAAVFLVTLILSFKSGYRFDSPITYYGRFLAMATHRIDQATYDRSFNPKMDQMKAVAKWLSSHTSPKERVFVLGDEPQIYALSGRSPVAWLTDKDTLQKLKAVSPTYMVDVLHQQADFPELYTLLASDYIPAERIGTAIIYRRWPSLSPGSVVK